MIKNILFWNSRSVNSQKFFGRLINLHKRHHFVLLICWNFSGSSRDTKLWKEVMDAEYVIKYIIHDLDFLGH